MKSCMLIEMARNIGKPFSMIENKPGYSEKIYDATTTWNKIGDVSSSTTIHHNKDGISDRYVIRDNAAFGKEREFENNHLILSHMPLTKFEGK